MKHKLFKLSEPGWELEFDSLKEIEYKLMSYLCSECKEEFMQEVIQGGDPVSEMLCTPCGLEFDIEGE